MEIQLPFILPIRPIYLTCTLTPMLLAVSYSLTKSRT